MKKVLFIFLAFFVIQFLFSSGLMAQCSICTKTASQLGEKPAQGLNSGIIYLMAMPLTIAGYVGFRWWKREKAFMHNEQE
ncbi:MAG: hypothetical protein JSS67_01490 [Bacteroidetes bacterium]|nr:hypothetical protein [Bacteroidota bacterium]